VSLKHTEKTSLWILARIFFSFLIVGFLIAGLRHKEKSDSQLDLFFKLRIALTLAAMTNVPGLKFQY